MLFTKHLRLATMHGITGLDVDTHQAHYWHASQCLLQNMWSWFISLESIYVSQTTLW